jgi:hypothetical protein
MMFIKMQIAKRFTKRNQKNVTVKDSTGVALNQMFAAKHGQSVTLKQLIQL